jgi:hypothetical protein
MTQRLGLKPILWLGLLPLLWLALHLWPDGPIQLLLLPLAAGSLAVLVVQLLTRSIGSNAPDVLGRLAFALGLLGLLHIAQGPSGPLAVAVSGVLAGLAWRFSARGLPRVLLLAGLALASLVWLATPRAALNHWPPSLARTFDQATFSVWPSVVVVLLIRLTASDRTQPRCKRLWATLGGLLLLAALGGLLLDSLVWDQATDGLSAIGMLLFAVVPASGAGLMLLGSETRWPDPAGAVLLAVGMPFVLFLTLSVSTALIDNRERTEARAAAVAAAIEGFYQRHQRYPSELAELGVWYTWRLYEPVMFKQAGWCYEGGADHYRFGFVQQPSFSSPASFITVKLYTSAGSPPQARWICDEQADALRALAPAMP